MYSDFDGQSQQHDDSQGNGYQGGYRNNYSDGGYGQRNFNPPKELYSYTIQGKKRKFFVDLKESDYGKFLKITEKSKGKKNVIMMDVEDFPEFMKSLGEIQNIINQ